MNGTWQDAQSVSLLEKIALSTNVRRLRVSKPGGYQFVPGEATDMVIDQVGWHGKRHAFTFTGLNEWEFLEFTIKIYPEHRGFTRQLDRLKPGDRLLIHDSFGAFHYRGPGCFLAGGSGLTPFLSILRQLEKEGRIEGNHLVVSNRRAEDSFLIAELEQMLGQNFVQIYTQEQVPGHPFGRIDTAFLSKLCQKDFPYYYICGKKSMMRQLKAELLQLGVAPERIIIEIDFSQQKLVGSDRP